MTSTGGIDPHTHLSFEFMSTETVDDFFSGQAAALAGGTTMHIDFVIPVDGSLTAGFEAYEKKAKKSCMDYGFHMAVTKWDEVVSKEMEIMVKEKGWFSIFAICLVRRSSYMDLGVCSFDFLVLLHMEFIYVFMCMPTHRYKLFQVLLGLQGGTYD